jgi:hypothetical protein
VTLKGRPCPTCGRPLPETAAEKLERLVDRSGGSDACWPYRGRLNRAGYGMLDVWVGGKNTEIRAHRFAYEAVAGPQGELAVLHLCDARYAPGDITYRRCCNPAHLTAGTRADNYEHMWRVGRQPTYTNHPKGQGVGTSKLTDGGVLEMRRRYTAGGTAGALAREYGVSQATAWNVIHGVTWAHLPGAVARRGRGVGSHVDRVYDPATQPRGETSPNAVLTEAAVLELRHRFAAGETGVDLAAEYGVTDTTAWNAIHGVTWAHVPDAQPKNVGRRGWPKGKPRGPQKAQ